MIQIENFTKETNLLSKGVYVITHKDTTIKYVGSTCCAGGFKDRWKRHLNGLLRGIGNRVLLNIFHKYGIDGFNFSIIEILDNHNEKEKCCYYDQHPFKDSVILFLLHYDTPPFIFIL